MRRRQFLKLAGAAAAAGTVAHWPGTRALARLTCEERVETAQIAHILPTVSSDRILIKVSFVEPQRRRPKLLVNGRRVRGRRTDGERRFWTFDARHLEPGQRYTLELQTGRCPLTDPWELSTFPAPDSLPEHFRLLVYTCAGGHDLFQPLQQPLAIRRRLLQRALTFEPDAVIANGDHVYWDLRSLPNALLTGASPAAKAFAGEFDRMAPVIGHSNELVLKRAVDGQIADLYGTLFRGVPVFFMRDDHDYFEDDRATEDLVTFPADPFMRELAATTQRFYYPEFLPDPNRPETLTASIATGARRRRGISESFGTLRYGRLVELLLYDCKGFVSLDGASGNIVPSDVEQWLGARMADASIRHVVNVPSNPPGWSAGKFGEWYPDVVVDGELTTAVPKFGWQEGWLAQHDRILTLASRMTGIPLFLSGDIHSVAEERILGSGANDFGGNPIVSVITGTPGTRLGWPSLARGLVATAPSSLQVETVVPVEEVNGFHIVDFEPDRVTIRHFRWSFLNDPVESIDTLMPFHVSSYQRSA